MPWKFNLQSDFSVFFLLLLVCFILHFPPIPGGFVLDDHYVIEQNPLIKNVGLLPQIFQTQLFDSYKAGWSFNIPYYRPLVTLSFLFDYLTWGLNAFGFRLTNVFLHALNGFFVFLLIKDLTALRPRALLTALIFAVLPPRSGWLIMW